MSAQTETTENEINNSSFTLEMAKSNESKINSSNKKRRLTTSMLYLDEEPVFSDSEEEKEYMRQIFGRTNHISPPKYPKNRDVEIQCDIISKKKTVIELINRCSLSNLDDTTRFPRANQTLMELLCLCKKIRGEMPKESAGFSNGSCNEEELFEDLLTENTQTTVVANTPVYASSEEFLPSSCGTYPQDKNLLSRSITENQLIPSKPFVCAEQSPSTDKEKVPKKRTETNDNSEEGLRRHSMRERRPPKQRYDNSIYFINKKQIAEEEKENAKKKLTSGLGKTLENTTGKIADKSHKELKKRCHPDLDSESESESRDDIDDSETDSSSTEESDSDSD